MTSLARISARRKSYPVHGFLCTTDGTLCTRREKEEGRKGRQGGGGKDQGRKNRPGRWQTRPAGDRPGLGKSTHEWTPSAVRRRYEWNGEGVLREKAWPGRKEEPMKRRRSTAQTVQHNTTRPHTTWDRGSGNTRLLLRDAKVPASNPPARYYLIGQKIRNCNSSC